MRIEGLTFGYDGALLFDQFSFASAGDVTILRGRTGCGKTTLLRLLCQFLRPRTVACWDVPPQARLILQEDALFPWLTVHQNLRLVKTSHPLSGTGILEPIQHLMHRRACELSFGQRRMAEICRAIIDAPTLLCFDEPFSFLDRSSRETAARLIRGAISTGTQVVLTTHHIDDISLFEGEVFTFPDEQPVNRLLRGE